MVSYDQWYAAMGRSCGGYRHLLEHVFGPDQYIGQQGFATRDQIVQLAQAAGAVPGARILDVCSGPAGPSACIAAATGCRIVSLDRSLPALRLAQGTVGPRSQLVAADAQRLPLRDGHVDGALVLDSLASIPEPSTLLRELARVVRPGGCVGFTAEVGRPLEPAERRGFIRTTVPLVQTLADWLALLGGSGFVPVAIGDYTASTAARASRFARGLVQEQATLGPELGQAAVDDLAVTLAAWAALLGSGRIAELVVVVRRAHAIRR